MNNYWFMNNVNLFKFFCPHKFKEFKNNHVFNVFNKNDYVYQTEDSASKLFLIENGKIKIGYITKEGDEVITAILSKGEIFGEKCLLGETKRNEFAQSIENNSTVCTVTLDIMEELLLKNKDLNVSIYKFLGYRLRKIERRLQILLFKDVKTRFIEFLNELYEDYGNKNPETGNIIIKHPYTQRELATLIGTSRPTLNIILNDLKEEKKLQFERNFIFLDKKNDLLAS